MARLASRGAAPATPAGVVLEFVRVARDWLALPDASVAIRGAEANLERLECLLAGRMPHSSEQPRKRA